MRSLAFWGLLSFCLIPALLPSFLPLRARAPRDLALELAGSSSLVWAILFGLVIAIPQIDPRSLLLRAPSIGARPLGPQNLNARGFLGQFLVLALGTLILVLTEGLAPFVVATWRPELAWGSAELTAILGGAPWLLARGAVLLALARVLGAGLGRLLGGVAFLGLVCATRFAEGSATEGAYSWVWRSAAMFMPPLSLLETAGSAMGRAVARVELALVAAGYICAYNLLCGMILGRRSGPFPPLDPPRGRA
ncbi:MAG: hypothetical protein R3F20_11620 [Planctomycetota bacterium]